MPELNNKYDLESFENVENQTTEEFENFLKYKFCTEIRRDNEIIFTPGTDNVAIVNEILELNKIIIKNPNNPDLYVERAKCLEKLDPSGAYYEGHRGYYDICKRASEEYDRYSEDTYFEDNYEMYIETTHEDELANLGLYELEPIVKVFEDECNRYTMANLLKALSITASGSPAYKVTYDIIKHMNLISTEEGYNLDCDQIAMDDTWIIKTINLYPSLLKDINILDLLKEFAEGFKKTGTSWGLPEAIEYSLAALELDNTCTRREKLIELLENQWDWKGAIHHAGIFLGVDNNFKWRRKIIELKFIHEGAQSALNEIVRLKNKLLPTMRDDSFLNIIAIICHCRLDNIKDAVCYYKENRNNINLKTEYPLDGYLYYFKELSDLCKKHKEENEACEYLKRHIDCLCAHADKLSSDTGSQRTFGGRSIDNDNNNPKRYFDKAESRYNDNGNADDAITEMFRSVISLLAEYNLNQDDFIKYSIIFSDSWGINNNLADKELHNLFKLSFYNFVLFLEYSLELKRTDYNGMETFEYLFKTCAVKPDNLNLSEEPTAYILNAPNWSKEYYDNLVKIKNIIFANRINDSYKIVELVSILIGYKRTKLAGIDADLIDIIPDEDMPLIMKYCLLDYMVDTGRDNKCLFNGYDQKTIAFLHKLISLWEDDKKHLEDKWKALELGEQKVQQAIEHEIALHNARLEERDRIISNQCHAIKNILRSIIDPLKLLLADGKNARIEKALKYSEVLRNMVNATGLSYSGSVDDYYHDTANNKNGISIKQMIDTSLNNSVSNIINDKEYYQQFWEKYFPKDKEYEEAKREFDMISAKDSDNPEELLSFINKYFCKITVSCKDSDKFIIGNEKNSGIKMLTLILEAIFNSVKYAAFQNKEKRFVSVVFKYDDQNMHIELSNSMVKGVHAKTTGEGNVIIDNFVKIMGGKPVERITGDDTFTCKLQFPNFWKGKPHGENLIRGR